MTYLGTFLGGCLKSKFKRLTCNKEGILREGKRKKDMKRVREREREMETELYAARCVFISIGPRVD